MKKINYVLAMLILAMSVGLAKPVSPSVAQTLAESFCKQNTTAKFGGLTLAYAETANGNPVYYVFNIVGHAGFIIIAADDAAHPVIGYSFEDNFANPGPKSNIAFWLDGRKKEIEVIRAKNLVADLKTQKEWKGIFNENTAAKGMSTAATQTVTALCATKWNQSPYYNQLCPGGSVTGCVATAMAQIMKFWNHPAMGQGSSSYTAGTYGTLSANYGATTYSWTSMPNTISGNNTAVATINSHAGISVEMNYSPSGSGAYVITGDNPVCAQASFVNYFKYDPATIQGLYRSSYTDPQWIALIEGDLTAGRPVEYVGTDPNAGGHTWVCDGFDASNNFHMNWGWGGSSNGYFNINNLAAGGDNFSTNHEILIGIKPLAVAALDAGCSAVTSPIGTICGSSISPVVTVKNFGGTTLTSCTINYKIDNGAVQTQAWSGSLANGATANANLPTISTTAGSHTLTVYTSNPNGSSDGNATNDQSTASFATNPSGLALPLAEGFETNMAIPSGWSLANPNADAAWTVVNTVAKTGTNCVGFNNCDGDGATDMTGRKDKLITSTYNFSNASSATMSFDVAYAVLTYSGTPYNDALQIYSSIDCGVTWTSIYNKSGSTLATAPGYTTIATCWAPSGASEWRNDVINLTGVLGQSSVMFAFENTSAWGTWIYLDNINIASMTTGIATHSADGFSLYPNPASGSVTIEVSGKANYSVYNMSGQEIKTGVITTNKETLSTNDMAGGIYFVKVSDAQGSHIKKLVVQ